MTFSPKTGRVWFDDTYPLNHWHVLSGKILVSPFDQFVKHHSGLTDMCSVYHISPVFLRGPLLCIIVSVLIGLSLWVGWDALTREREPVPGHQHHEVTHDPRQVTSWHTGWWGPGTWELCAVSEFHSWFMDKPGLLMDDFDIFINTWTFNILQSMSFKTFFLVVRSSNNRIYD